MKVVQQTLTLLTLREHPVGLWLLSSLTAIIGLVIFLSANPPLDWFGLFCIFGADLIIFASPIKTCEFNKQRNSIIFQQKGWLGTKVISCPINQVRKIKIESVKLLGIKFYRLSLILLKRQRLYLTPIPSTDRQLQQNLADCIQQFLS